MRGRGDALVRSARRIAAPGGMLRRLNRYGGSAHFWRTAMTRPPANSPPACRILLISTALARGDAGAAGTALSARRRAGPGAPGEAPPRPKPSAEPPAVPECPSPGAGRTRPPPRASRRAGSGDGAERGRATGCPSGGHPFTSAPSAGMRPPMGAPNAPSGARLGSPGAPRQLRGEYRASPAPDAGSGAAASGATSTTAAAPAGGGDGRGYIRTDLPIRPIAAGSYEDEYNAPYTWYYCDYPPGITPTCELRLSGREIPARPPYEQRLPARPSDQVTALGASWRRSRRRARRGDAPAPIAGGDRLLRRHP